MAYIGSLDQGTSSTRFIVFDGALHPSTRVTVIPGKSGVSINISLKADNLFGRIIAFNSIMYAPGGMPRAERELGANLGNKAYVNAPIDLPSRFVVTCGIQFAA